MIEVQATYGVALFKCDWFTYAHALDTFSGKKEGKSILESGSI